MKIFMTALFDTRISDASLIHVCEIANSFVKLGNQVTLLTTKWGTDNLLLDSKINIQQIPFFYKDSIFNAMIFSVLQFFYFLLSKKDYDIFYLRWRLLPIGFFKFLCFKKDIKFVTEHNGWIESEMKLQYKNKLWSKFGKFLQILDAIFSEKVIVVTQGIKDKLLSCSINSEKVIVVGNGTNLEKFHPILNRKIIKHNLLHREEIVLGFMGNIAKWQGVDFLINAFCELRNVNDKIILVIIGDGKYKEEIKQMTDKSIYKNDILIKDNVPYNEVNLWINLFDIALAPKSGSLNDIGYSPLKIRDYCAAGKAVVSSKVNGIKELEGNGWLWTYKEGDYKEFIDIILKIINNENFEIIEKQARDYSKRYFSWDVCAEKILISISQKTKVI